MLHVQLPTNLDHRGLHRIEFKSLQCREDIADAEEWERKFVANEELTGYTMMRPYKDILRDSHHTMIVYAYHYPTDQVVAQCVWYDHIASTETDDYLTGLVVAPAYQGQGIAVALLHYLFDELRPKSAKVSTHIACNNHSALKTLINTGFRIHNNVANYCLHRDSSSVDVFSMRRELLITSWNHSGEAMCCTTNFPLPMFDAEAVTRPFAMCVEDDSWYVINGHLNGMTSYFSSFKAPDSHIAFAKCFVSRKDVSKLCANDVIRVIDWNSNRTALEYQNMRLHDLNRCTGQIIGPHLEHNPHQVSNYCFVRHNVLSVGTFPNLAMSVNLRQAIIDWFLNDAEGKCCDGVTIHFENGKCFACDRASFPELISTCNKLSPLLSWPGTFSELNLAIHGTTFPKGNDGDEKKGDIEMRKIVHREVAFWNTALKWELNQLYPLVKIVHPSSHPFPNDWQLVHVGYDTVNQTSLQKGQFNMPKINISRALDFTTQYNYWSVDRHEIPEDYRAEHEVAVMFMSSACLRKATCKLEICALDQSHTQVGSNILTLREEPMIVVLHGWAIRATFSFLPLT